MTTVEINGHSYDLTPVRGVGKCRCGNGVQGYWFNWRDRYAPPLLQEDGAATVDRDLGIVAPCPACGRLTALAQVKGRLKPEILCSDKCRNATGPSCDCSCGGENHGCNH